MAKINLESEDNKPVCPLFGECSGCSYQNISYKQELKKKEVVLYELLSGLKSFNKDVLEPIVPSPQIYHYRHRFDLSFKKTLDKEIYIGFSPQGRRGVIPVDACPIANKAISDFIPQLKQEVKETLSPKYKRASLVVRSGEDLKVRWGGIGKGSLQMKEADYFYYTVNGRRIFYSLDTFFQANLSILPSLFEKIISLPIWTKDSVFFDLYGGVGLFSIGLIDCVRSSVLIESNPSSVKLARYSRDIHQLQDFEIVEGRVENNLSLISSKSQSEHNVALIDPPRAGLSLSALHFLKS